MQTFLENLSIWFQGGVRRSVIIFIIVSLILLTPIYFIGIVLSSAWYYTPFNPGKQDTKSYYIPKSIPEKSLIISSTQVVELKGGAKELYFSINNKENDQIGYFPFIYDIQVLDEKGAAINQETRETYILPSDIRYITYRSNDGRANKLVITRNTRTVPVFYNPLSKTLKNPNLEISNQKVNVRTFTDFMSVSFTIKNNDKIKIKKTDLIFIVRDKRDSVVGVGDFVLDNLTSGEQRDVEIPYLQPLEREPSLVEIIPIVNYLDSDNLVLN
jgi:hypothetical protein